MENPITLKALQEYIKGKDFKPDLKNAYFQKLIEEVGELAEAILKGNRLNKDEAIKGTIDEELYDALYYIIALANVYEIDLEKAFYLKEKLNEEKYK